MAPDTIVCVALDSGPCYGRVLAPSGDVPAGHLLVDLSGVLHHAPVSLCRALGGPDSGADQQEHQAERRAQQGVGHGR